MHESPKCLGGKTGVNKKSHDYFAFFSLSLRHKPITTSISPINHAKYPYAPKFINRPPLTKDEININIPIITNNKFITLISPPEDKNNFFINKTTDYFRFLKYLIPKTYAMMVITIRIIKPKLIGVLTSLFKRNILKISKRIHSVKRTATACTGVLTGGGTIIISQNDNCFGYISIFGGFISRRKTGILFYSKIFQ